ncbi:MAG TPA: metallophosphoesterase, partial [Spirochaetota bacterium]|nr:metallophosphoesterase [Spirochaetota bacterium]
MKLILIISIVILLFSCDYVDISGLFNSSKIEERFNEKDTLKNFLSPSVNPDDYSFLVIADPHYYKTQPNFIKYIDAKKSDWNISFIVINGDLVQNGSKESYDLYLDDTKNSALPIYPVIGNHDIYFNGYEIYKKLIGRTV